MEVVRKVSLQLFLMPERGFERDEAGAHCAGREMARLVAMVSCDQRCEYPYQRRVTILSWPMCSVFSATRH